MLVGVWALISAGTAWTTRREAFAVAAAAARAGAQGSSNDLRTGAGVVDGGDAVGRAQAVITTAGYTGQVVVENQTVTVTVNAPVSYVLAPPGMPTTVTGQATAVARRGITGQEGG
jgi:hypothetical protein